VESTVKRNSNCRKEMDVVSCFDCPKWDECQANNFDELVGKKRKLAEQLGDDKAWEIEKEIRNK
jgi:hypothetical protein